MRRATDWNPEVPRQLFCWNLFAVRLQREHCQLCVILGKLARWQKNVSARYISWDNMLCTKCLECQTLQKQVHITYWHKVALCHWLSVLNPFSVNIFAKKGNFCQDYIKLTAFFQRFWKHRAQVAILCTGTSYALAIVSLFGFSQTYKIGNIVIIVNFLSTYPNIFSVFFIIGNIWCK